MPCCRRLADRVQGSSSLPPQCLQKTRPSSFLKYTCCVRYYLGSTWDKKKLEKNKYIDVISLSQILYTRDEKESNVFHPAINGRTGEAARLASLRSRDVILAARQDVRHSIIKTATALRSQVKKIKRFRKRSPSYRNITFGQSKITPLSH